MVPVNDAPMIGLLDSLIIDEDETIGLGLFAEDIDEDSLVFTATSIDSNITPIIIGDSLVLDPALNWYGDTDILVSVSDGYLMDTTSFALAVLPVNDAPVITLPDTLEFEEDSHINIVFDAIDVDQDSLVITVSSDTADVNAVIADNNLLINTPENWNGSSIITVIASDSIYADTAYVHLNIIAVNDPPGDFSLLSPENDIIIDINPMNVKNTLWFNWTPSTDVDDDALHYMLSLLDDISILDTLFTSADTTLLWIEYAVLYGLMYPLDVISGDWSIIVTDGIDSVQSENGPFSLTIDVTSMNVDQNSLIPEVFALHQNYPNPFNPTTKIRYDLPIQSHVNIIIYDIMGRQVKLLINKQQDPGYQSIIWNATNNFGQPVSAGMYIYTIQADSFRKTKKMVLLK